MNRKPVYSIIREIASAAVCGLAVCLFVIQPVRAAFEDIEVGPRATALGGACVTQSDSAVSMFYNPAGIAGLSQMELTTSHEKMFWGLTDDSSPTRDLIASGFPVILRGRYYGTLGVSINRLSLEDLYKEDMMLLGYAAPVSDRVHAGVNIRRFSVSYGETLYTKINPVFENGSDASAYGFDIGVLYIDEKVHYGASVQNLNEPDVGLKYENKIDRKINIGVCAKREIVDLNLALNYYQGNTRLKTGAEMWVLNKHVACRGGLNFGSRDYRNVALGIGYLDGWFRLDYSFQYPLSGITDTMGHHQIGATFRWGNPVEKKVLFRPVLIDKGGAQSLIEKDAFEKTVMAREYAHAQELVKYARQNFSEGNYKDGILNMASAKNTLKNDLEVIQLYNKALKVFRIYPDLAGSDVQSKFLRKGINKYLSKEGDLALLIITYANQLWKDDLAIESLLNEIRKDYPEESSNLKLVPGMTIVDQLLQDGLSLILDGKYTDAIIQFEKVLEITPNNTTALTRMGSAYWAIGQEQTARMIWERVLKLEPDNKQIREFLNREK